MSQLRLKSIATIVMLIPTGFFLILVIEEGANAWPHYVQFIMILAPIILGWFYPREVGYVLIIFGILLAIAYAFFSVATLPAYAIFVIELIVFAPIVVSGFLFVRSFGYP